MRLPDDVCRCHDNSCYRRRNCLRWIERNNGGERTPRAETMFPYGDQLWEKCEYFKSSDKLEDTYKLATVEMFRRVGLEFSYDECLEWSKDQGKNWYWCKSWSESEEKDFMNWMVRLIKKRHSHLKHVAKNQVDYFVMYQGWKTKCVG